MGGKWLELLKEIAPGVQRVAVIRDLPSRSASGYTYGYLNRIQTSRLGGPKSFPPRPVAEIEPVEKRVLVVYQVKASPTPT